MKNKDAGNQKGSRGVGEDPRCQHLLILSPGGEGIALALH